MDQPAFSRVLDAIYDAATSFDRWPAALERVGEVFGASYVGLIDRNLNTMEGRAVAVGIDLASQREYFNVWSTHDVLRQWTPAYRAGAVQTDRDILPRTELLRSDYYNGFMKPRDMHAVLRLTLAVEPGFRKIISMTRPISLGDYSTSDVARSELLMPHLLRAASVSQLEEFEAAAYVRIRCAGAKPDRRLAARSRSDASCSQTVRHPAMARASDGFVLREGRIEVLHRSIRCLLAAPDCGRDRPARPCRRAARRGDAHSHASPASRTTRSWLPRWPESSSLLGSGPVAFLLIADARVRIGASAIHAACSCSG